MVALPKAPPPPPGVVCEPGSYIVVHPTPVGLSDLITYRRFPWRHVLVASLMAVVFVANVVCIGPWLSMASGDDIVAPVFLTIVSVMVWLIVIWNKHVRSILAWLGHRYSGTNATFWNHPKTGALQLGGWNCQLPREALEAQIMVRLPITGITKSNGAILTPHGALRRALRGWTVRLASMNDHAVFVNVADSTNSLCMEVRDLITLLEDQVAVRDHPERLDLATIVCGMLRAYIRQQRATEEYRNRLDAWNTDENSVEAILIDLIDDIMRTRRYVKSKEGLHILSDALRRYVVFLTERGDPSRRHYDRILCETDAELVAHEGSPPAPAAPTRQS